MTIDWEPLTRMAFEALPVLLDATVKATLLLLAAGAAALALRKASASARQMVWVLALAGLIVLPLASAALPSWAVLPGWATFEIPPELVESAPPAPASPVSTEFARSDPIGGADRTIANVPAAAYDDVPKPDRSVAPTAPAIAPAPAREPYALVTATTTTRPDAARSWQSWAATSAVFLWLAGTLVSLLPVVLGRLSLWRLARRSWRIADGSWAMLARRAASAIGLRRPVAILQSYDEPMPMVWGTLRAKLLLPADAEDWSAQRRWVVLLHELAHVKRRDCLAKFVAHVACSLYWFNPLCWIVFKQMQREAETACDDLVLSSQACASRTTKSISVRPSDYAQHLLEIASGLKSGMLVAYSSIAMARRSKLEGRLLAILDGNRNRRSLTRIGILVAAILVTAVAVPLACLRATQNDSPAATQPTTLVAQLARLGITPASTKRMVFADDEGGFGFRTRVEGAMADQKAVWNAIAIAKPFTRIAFSGYRRVEFYTAAGAAKPKAILLVNETDACRLPGQDIKESFRCPGLHKQCVSLLREEYQRQHRVTAPPTGKKPSNAQPRLVGRLASGIEVELLGVGQSPSTGKPWWRADGSPLADPPYDHIGAGPAKPGAGEVGRELALFEAWGGVDRETSTVNWVITPNRGWASHTPCDANGRLMHEVETRNGRAWKVSECHAIFANLPGETVTIRRQYAAGTFVERATLAVGTTSGGATTSPGKCTVMPLVKASNGVFVKVADLPLDLDYRLFAIDANGQEISAGQDSGQRYPDKRTQTLRFLVRGKRLDDIRRVRVESRPFDQWVEFRNVSVRPGVKTNVQVVTSDMVAASRQPTGKPSVGIYLITGRVKNAPKDPKKFTLADYTLADKPLIGKDDIFAYDWESHTIRLKQQSVADRILKRGYRGGMGSFIVVANGKRLYQGAFLSMLSSVVPTVPVIHVGPTAGQFQPKMAVRIHRPPITGSPDPRNDARLKQALQALKLVRQPHPAREPADKQAGGKLEFRIVPNGVGSSRSPTLPLFIGDSAEKKYIPAALKELADHGPDPARKRDDEFQWFELAGQMDCLNVVMERHKGREYVLLAAREPYALVPGEGKAAWGLAKVYATKDGSGRPAIGFELDDPGAKRFAALTKVNVGNHLAIVIGGKVVSAPKLMSAFGKRGMITGQFSGQEVARLVKALKAGMKPTKPPVTQPAKASPLAGLKLRLVLVDKRKKYRIGETIKFKVFAENTGKQAVKFSLNKYPPTSYSNKVEGGRIRLHEFGLFCGGETYEPKFVIQPGQSELLDTEEYILMGPDWMGNTEGRPAVIGVKPRRYNVSYRLYPNYSGQTRTEKLDSAPLVVIDVLPGDPERIRQLTAKYPSGREVAEKFALKFLAAIRKPDAATMNRMIQLHPNFGPKDPNSRVSSTAESMERMKKSQQWWQDMARQIRAAYADHEDLLARLSETHCLPENSPRPGSVFVRIAGPAGPRDKYLWLELSCWSDGWRIKNAGFADSKTSLKKLRMDLCAGTYRANARPAAKSSTRRKAVGPWITIAPRQETIASIEDLRVLYHGLNLPIAVGRSGTWEIRTADQRTIATLPARLTITTEPVEGVRNIRSGSRGLDKDQRKRIGKLPDGEYRLAWKAGGKRLSNVVRFRIKKDYKPRDEPLLSLKEIESPPGEMPFLIIRAYRHNPRDPAPRAFEVAYATLNVDGRDLFANSREWAGLDYPLKVGRCYAYLVNLNSYTDEQGARGHIQLGRKHVVFAKAGPKEITRGLGALKRTTRVDDRTEANRVTSQSAPITLSYDRSLCLQWDRASGDQTPAETPAGSEEEVVFLADIVIPKTDK